MNPIKKLALATTYVTCIPLPPFFSKESSDSELKGLAKYLPTVGLMIGAILVLTVLLLQMAHTNNLLASALITLTWLVITGGIHFDGLMDTADGVFSHQNRQRMLEIMQDSRVGNFGVMTGFSIILIKFTCLASLSPPAQLPALLLVPAWARWCETFAISAFPYAKETGKGKVWHDTSLFPHDVIWSAIVPSGVTILLSYSGSLTPILFTVLSIVAGLISACLFNTILKGQTGDTYGAIVELSEAGALLFFNLLGNCMSSAVNL